MILTRQTCGQHPCIVSETLDNMNNSNQMSLWCVDGHSTILEPDPNKLVELAYLLQGTGGGDSEGIKP